MKIIYLFVVVLLLACHQGKPDKTISQKGSIGKMVLSPTESTSEQLEYSLIQGSIGILTYNTNILQSQEVEFFNDNGTLWDGLGDAFKPFSWHPDYGTLAIRCIEIKNDTCKVIVNEEFELVKNYPLKNEGLVFQTWEEHILGLFSVGFDQIKNPLRKDPSSDAAILSYDYNLFYHPNQIQGEWLQVKYGTEGNWNYGWILWRSKDNLIVEFYYFA